MKTFFLIAAAFNFFVVFLFLFFMDGLFPIFELEVNNSSITFMHLFLALVLLFGVAYLTIAFDPVRFRELILFGALSKLILVLVGTLDVVLGYVSWPIVIPLVGDIVFALAFLKVYFRLAGKGTKLNY